jgi:hypothetical protein
MVTIVAMVPMLIIFLKLCKNWTFCSIIADGGEGPRQFISTYLRKLKN